MTLSNATWEATHWEHTVYLHSRVMFLGEIDLKSQSFGARFDLHVMWDPDSLPEEMEDFNPIIRFPEAITWRENARVDISGDSGGVLNGHRSIIEGRFRTHMNLEMFPFDAQALKVEMQLGNFALTLSFPAMGQPNPNPRTFIYAVTGRDKTSGKQLYYRDGWRLDHHPTEPNIMVNQMEAGVKFRPLRYSLSTTGLLESSDVIPKYTLWVPMERDYSHYVLNHVRPNLTNFPITTITTMISLLQYFFGALVALLGCSVPFYLKVEDKSGRTTAFLELYL